MGKKHVCLWCGSLVDEHSPDCPACKKKVNRFFADRFQQRECIAVRKNWLYLRAWDKVDGREVFARVLLPGASVIEQEALHNEVRLLRAASGASCFPDLVTVGTLRETGGLYAVQEFIHGEPLSRVIQPLSLVQRLEYLMECVDLVAGLHNAGIVYCALSLDHFLVVPDGRLALVDFRAVRKTGERSARSGTAGYQAPEQDNPIHFVTPATDVFALGVALYFLLTNKMPYGKEMGSGRWKVRKPPRAPSSLNPSVTAAVDEIVLTAMALAPDARFTSAVELANALHGSFGRPTVMDGLPYVTPSSFDLFWEEVWEEIVGCGLAIAALVRGVGQALMAGWSALWVTPAGKRTRPIGVAVAMVAAALLSRFVLMHGTSHPGVESPTASVNGIGLRSMPREPRMEFLEPVDEPVHIQILSGVAQSWQTVGSGLMANGDSLEPPRLPANEMYAGTYCSMQFLSWPPSYVYLDERYVGEAPSPTRVILPGGEHRLVLVGKRGERLVTSLRLKVDHTYTLKNNFDTNTFRLEDNQP